MFFFLKLFLFIYIHDSLRFKGGDLAYVFCAKEAAIPIKSYSPEIMVTPFYSFESVEDVGDDDGRPEKKNTFREKDIIMTILEKKALAAVMKHLPR